MTRYLRIWSCKVYGLVSNVSSGLTSSGFISFFLFLNNDSRTNALNPCIAKGSTTIQITCTSAQSFTSAEMAIKTLYFCYVNI